MGGKRKNKQKIPYYYMSIHYGICHGPIDALNQIWIKEKVVFCAEATEPMVMYLNRPELFGGETKEGGISGAVECYFGTHDQKLTQPSAGRFGKTTDTMVGYRGVANMLFRGLEDFERHNAPSPVKEDGSAFALGVIGFMGGIFKGALSVLFGGNSSGANGAGFAGFFGKSLSVATDLFDPVEGASASGGGFWWITNNPYLPAAWAHVTRISRPFGLTGKPWEKIMPPVEGAEEKIGVFSSGESGHPYTVVDLSEFFDAIDQGAATMTMRFGASAGSNIDGFDTLLQQCQIRFLDAGGGLIDYEYEQGFFDGGGMQTLTRLLPVGTRTVEMKGTGTLFFPVFANWGPGEGSWVLNYGPSGALLCPGSGAVGSPYDANPAFIIAECLTNRQWGMGHPIAGLDEPSFMAAAQALYYEHFGISLMWASQSTIEKFISEILDHIQGTLFINPRTGLWTLRLIRGDYDAGTLRTLNKTNCTTKNRQRKAEGEIINEVVISYKDFQTEEDKTVTFHDLAGVAQLGQIVSDTRNYYGIRSDWLANVVGARDIRTASFPLFTCDIEADRSFSDVTPGDVLKLDEEKDGIVGMVVRILKVDYGQPGDSKVRFNVTEDIFALEATEYRSVQPSLWVDPDRPPAPLTRQRVVDVPLPLLLRSGYSESDLTDDKYPEVVTGLFGDDPTQDISHITVWGDYVSPSGVASQRDFANINRTPSTTLAVPLVPEAATAFPGSRLRAMLDGGNPESGDFLYIDGGNADGEVVMLDTYNSGTDTWTMARGIFDTVPRNFTAGTIVWYLGTSVNSFDPTLNTAGVQTTFKMLPTNNAGTLMDIKAPPILYTPSERPYLPFRPAKCTLAGVSFGEVHYDPLLGAGIPVSVALTWVNRNRLQEDGLAARWEEPNVTPEIGQTTTIRVRERYSRAVTFEATGEIGTSYTLDVTALLDYRFYDVEFIAVRDGFESLQWHSIGLDIERFGYGSDYGFDYNENDGI